jgi:predicted TIM-barrel fold metal-dependent hydrolase
MRIVSGLWLLAVMPGSLAGQATGARRAPVIDVHLHAWSEERDTAGYTRAWLARATAMDSAGITLAVVSGPMDIVEHWRRLAGTRLLVGVLFPCPNGLYPTAPRPCFPTGDSLPDLGWLRREILARRIVQLGEITAQYLGVPPSHPMLEPYFALAEELDVPVAIHMGLGPPGAAYPNGVCGPAPCALRYRADVTSPLLLEPVLARHPRLRVIIMHAGWPMLEDLVILLWSHPHVSVDLARLGHEDTLARPLFHEFLCRLVEYGFGDRIMYGSDRGTAFRESLEGIETAPCMTTELTRAILHDNAVRFHRLSSANAP